MIPIFRWTPTGAASAHLHKCPTRLHGYLASHKQPFPLAIADIRRAADLTIARPDNLRAAIVRALDALAKVGFVVSWEIDGEHVKVIRR